MARPSQVGKPPQRVLGMVSEVRDMGMEVCATLGMLNHEQARQLREAGLTAYNHNVDTSPEFYPKVTTSRNYEDRLNTIAAVGRRASACAAEGSWVSARRRRTRASMLRVLANLPGAPRERPDQRLGREGNPVEKLEPPSGLRWYAPSRWPGS